MLSITRLISITKVYFICDSADLISLCCRRLVANSIKCRAAGAQVDLSGMAIPTRIDSEGSMGILLTLKSYFYVERLLVIVIPMPASIMPNVAAVSIVS